jgi:hypothetical protein
MLNLSQDKIIEILLDVNFWQQDRFCGVERGTYLDKIFRLDHPLHPSLEVSAPANGLTGV